MAEVIEGTTTTGSNSGMFASKGQNAAALSLGIIGTALAGMTLIGGGAGLLGLFRGNSSGSTSNNGSASDNLTPADLYIERNQCEKYIDLTKEYYQGKLDSQREFADLFFQSYQRDVQNSFDLYKYTRDSNDALAAKIADVNSKVDVMAAIRPYQDALIDSKIDRNALLADYNLDKKTCKMINGQLVLPSTPVVSGYPSYNPFVYLQQS